MAVYFHTDWCGFCRRLEQNIRSDAEVQRYLDGEIIKVRINPEAGPEERSLAQRYAVSGYPSFFVVAGPGMAPQRLSPFRRDFDRWVPMAPSDFVQACRQLAAGGHGRSDSVETLSQASSGEAEPQTAEAYYARGFARAQSGMKDEAARDFKMSIMLDPNHARAYDALAQLCLERGQADEAIDYLSRLIKAQPTYQNGQAHYLRAVAYSRKGDASNAKNDAETACRNGNQNGCRFLDELRRETAGL